MGKLKIIRLTLRTIQNNFLFTSKGDRYNIHSQLEHLQSKYVGTGHADTAKWDWLTNINRDSLASYLGE